MIRNDFVSNSSSSSYIIISKKDQKEIFDYITDNCLDEHNDSYCTNENKKFLKQHFNKYVNLIIGDFKLFGYDSEWMEQTEENSKKGLEFYNCIVRKSDVEKYIKDGKVQVKHEDLIGKEDKRLRYSGYKIYEITQDSIDFTRWFMKKSIDENSDKDYKEFLSVCEEMDKIYLQYCATSNGNKKLEYPKELEEKYESLWKICKDKNLFIKSKYCHSKKINEKWENIVEPLEVLLDKYEKELKEGNRIYRICFGHGGEGSDWNSYIWVEKFDFLKGNKDIKFIYDPFW